MYTHRTQWKTYSLIALIVLGVVLGGAVWIRAAPTPSIDRWVSGSGAQLEQGNVTLNNTLGQPVVGNQTQGSTQLCAGFWCQQAGLLDGLGGTVWHDADNNAAYEAGTESGIGGVVIGLYQQSDDPETDTPIMTTTTNANGDYAFVGVSGAPTYTVAIADTQIVTYTQSSSGGDHDPTATDDDQSNQGDDGVPSGDYVVTQGFAFDPAQRIRTVDFGFNGDPNAVGIQSFKGIQRRSTRGWILTVATAASGLLVAFRIRKRKRHSR
jgi:hypothetical protein